MTSEKEVIIIGNSDEVTGLISAMASVDNAEILIVDEIATEVTTFLIEYAIKIKPLMELPFIPKPIKRKRRKSYFGRGV